MSEVIVSQQNSYSFRDHSLKTSNFSSSPTLISTLEHSDIDVSFTSTNNKYDENTTTEYLNVDIRICTMNYVGSINTIRAAKPKDISFLFRFNQEALSICLNSMKIEIRIL
ncbi:2280_t:CDS:2 [Dentiscutata heterogama]|uniref:2280_t:CDS:1 n=1 Tax=Dentiscutata heterogama TaxID=1316150 RepID=A0ACA9NKP9_9GLOM|nr:2280_t:CDS:2 [Dentiscutata heterogama]